MNNFKILQTDGQARIGILKTPHGDIQTPNFSPVGTLATVKAVSPKDLNDIGIQMVLANTYHLMLRPGAELIEKLGGLHKFMGWNKPIMTDSGGFQVFSLGIALEQNVGKLLRENSMDTSEMDIQQKPRLNKITEEGVYFQSHLDGSKQFLSPESSMKIQNQLGADLIIAFDDLESPKYSYEETLKSLELTERWGVRSLEALRTQASPGVAKQLLFGVTHGGIFEDLRIRSAKFTDQNFDGIALGGAHKDRKTLYQVVEWTVANISDEKPRHLLGIGEPEDLIEGSLRGIDLFDCVAPTRRARNGSLYISPKSGGNLKNHFILSISQAKYFSDPKPIDQNCACYTCQNFSRAYLRHLFLSRELLYHQLSTIHNLYFINNLMEEIREAIGNKKLNYLKTSWLG